MQSRFSAKRPQACPTPASSSSPAAISPAAPALYLARVRAAKRSRDQIYAVIDGGMHHHLAASGNLGQVIKKDYPIVLAERPGRSA